MLSLLVMFTGIRDIVAALDSLRIEVLGFFIGVCVLWLCAVALSSVLHDLRIGRPTVGLARRYRIPSPPKRHSVQVSDDRRNNLQRFLAEFSEIPGVPVEFIEVPPGLEINSGDFPKDETTQFWRAARLHLQLDNDQRLLLERVTDALICLYRANRITSEDFPESVRLERIPRAQARESFPWRVLITTANPAFLKNALSKRDVQDWLGIGIDFVTPSGLRKRHSEPGVIPPEGFVPQGRCIRGSDGLEGTVGGIIHDQMDNSYGVTCRHVLSSGCFSLFWHGERVKPLQHEFTQESPDAAFISLGSPCFAQIDARTTSVFQATQSDLDLAVERESKVRKAPDADGIAGVVVFAHVSGFKLGKHFYRGPHFQITPNFRTKFWITWPLSRRFSKAGDSGAWVIDPDTRRWLGMIVGGLSWPNTVSVALCSEYVCDAFQRMLAANPTRKGSGLRDLDIRAYE
jgi:hypothetical protein